MNELVDLKLKLENEEYFIKDLVEKYKITTILGSPGSGKTQTLKKYEQDFGGSKFITVREFLEEDEDYSDTKVLLLDAVDEYRGANNPKKKAIENISYKLKKCFEKNKQLKVAITCRDMDWYDETDKDALKNKLKCEDNDICVARLLPLDDELQRKFAKIFGISDEDSFFEKFKNFDFLQNPQIFKMLVGISDAKDDIKTKSDIFEKYIDFAREHNKEHAKEELSDIWDLSGYIAFFYIFSDEYIFDEDFIDKIVSEESGYKRESIEKTLRSKLFFEKTFSHRTIAEFVLAKFINEKLYKYKKGLLKERLLKLFVKNEKIPTSLRGTYSWFCAISKDSDFIKIDPYYQLYYGDCSLLNLYEKKDVIHFVKEHSKTNPYFMRNTRNMYFLTSFYDEGLDDLLISEFEKIKGEDSHYRYFISSIISKAKYPSEKIKDFVKQCLMRKEINNSAVKMFKDGDKFLFELFDLIKDGKVADENNDLKDEILNLLYPKHISQEEIVDYLTYYEHSRQSIEDFSYLCRTPYEDKYKLIDQIYDKLCSKGFYYQNIDSFIEDYFYETICKYEEDELSADDVFKIIMHFYGKKCFKIEYRSFYFSKKTISDEKWQKLANELFDLFVEKCISENNIWEIYRFEKIFNLKKDAENKDKVIFSNLNKSLSKEINEELFKVGFRLSKDKEDDKSLYELAKKYNLNSLFSKLQIDYEKELKKQKETIERISKNELYFKNRSDEEILKSLDDLYFISEFIFYGATRGYKIKECLKDETIIRLKRLLKQVLYLNPVDNAIDYNELIDINKNQKVRKVDVVYISSIDINNDIDMNKIINDDFLEYLYIISVLRIYHIYTEKFIYKVEKNRKDFCIDVLRKFLGFLVKKSANGNGQILIDIIDKEDNLNVLKRYSRSLYSENSMNNFIHDILYHQGFNLAAEQLETIKALCLDDLSLLESILLIKDNDKINFKERNALSIYEAFFDVDDRDNTKHEKFSKLDRDLKIRIMEFIICNVKYSYLYMYGLLSYLNLEELKDLLPKIDKNNRWRSSLLHKISRLEQEKIDEKNEIFGIEKIKDFIFKNEILNDRDFFEDICIKVDKLKDEIEDNINNDKNAFYNGNRKKAENDCRDVIVTRLKDKYDSDILIARESHTGDNRVDIDIKDKNNLSYQVQIECKKDDNRKLYNGIKTQLIDKYLSSGVSHGIYLVLYFGDKKDKDELMIELKEKIPENYKEKIKIICIDLRKQR